jgi:hypothetical protein
MAYQNKNCNTGKYRVVSYVCLETVEFIDSKKIDEKRSTTIKKILNEAKLCEQLFNKTVWQVMQDYIKLKKELNK